MVQQSKNKEDLVLLSVTSAELDHFLPEELLLTPEVNLLFFFFL